MSVANSGRAANDAIAGIDWMVLNTPMGQLLPTALRAAAALVLYLWSAVAALSLSYFAGWQYDGDIGWWVAMIYAFPAAIIGSPIARLVGDAYSVEVVCLVALGMVTIGVGIAMFRFSRKQIGS